MKRLMKENVASENVGDALLRAPKRDPWNSFSKPVRVIDRYPRSKKVIGKLNPTLEAMDI